MGSNNKAEPSLLRTNSPDTLFEQAMDMIVNNIQTFTNTDYAGRWRKVNSGIVLPAEICDRFLEAYQTRNRINDHVANLFRDRTRCKLGRIKLRNSRITDVGLKIFLEHKPTEVELIHCEYLSPQSLEHINTYCHKLVTLKIGASTNIIPQDDFSKREYFIKATTLRHLTIQRKVLSHFPLQLLQPLTHLAYLDLSECTSLGPINYLKEMKSLEVLVLYNVYWVQEIISWILTIPNLSYLDISQSHERFGKYERPDETLKAIVTKLPHLRSLDISGTNLAGSGVAVDGAGASNNLRCDIPGLTSRVDDPLEFLGLYGTQHGACKRHDIPAEVVTGDANENQILTAAHAYMERPEMLTRILNDLYYQFRYESHKQVVRALLVVLEAMNKHYMEKHIQISGSAILFYIVKGKERRLIEIKYKKKIISALLSGMEAHIGDETMMRNGCLTLCQFKSGDVVFEFERMVMILLHGISDVNQEGFVQRIAIYLLNALACQVDEVQKDYLGSHGAIEKMLKLIQERLERRVCDDVLEVAWSTLWNVTDETPANCMRFLDAEGMEYFLRCFKSFPDKEEMLRNMMGLLGNVAEVEHLRSYLMSPVYLKVFYDLLESTSDGIEVSYNAAGVLVHMASDGVDKWTVQELSRETVLERVSSAVERWDISADRNINYRSFEPILGLLRVYHTPQCQHWAVWALANLTNVYPDKYCRLVESEGGMALLLEMFQHPDPYPRIKELAMHVINNCNIYLLRVEVADIDLPTRVELPPRADRPDDN